MPGHALRRRDRHHRRYLRRLLGSGGAAAPERESLALLPSGPDAVRTLPVRGTRSSTPRAQTLSRRNRPSDGIRSRWSGFRVQGTADSPPSATGQAEGTTSARDYHRGGPVIEATLYTDAGCPWAYSANPALRVLEWRFRDQLSWRLVMIGLREEASEAAVRAYDPRARARALARVRGALRNAVRDRRQRSGPRGTGRGCRAVVAAGLLEPGQRVGGCSVRSRSRTSRGSVYLDDAESIREALAPCPKVDARPHRRDARRRARSSPSTSASSPRRARLRARLRMPRTRRHPLTAGCGSPRRRSCSVAASNRRLREAGSHSSPTTVLGELRSRARARAAT